jgi:hypothetical protein
VAVKTEEIVRPRKVALYQHARNGWFTLFEIRDEDAFEREDYVRVSNAVDIQFEPLTVEVVAQQAQEVFQKMETSARNSLNRELRQIEFARSKFLALAHDVPDDSPQVIPARPPQTSDSWDDEIPF